MIKRLKRRFIVLAMVSLTVLLAVLVTGMNAINYSKVVSDADSRLEVIEENSDRLLSGPNGTGDLSGGPGMSGDPGAGMDDNKGGFLGDGNKSEGDNGQFFGPGGPGGSSMTRDEAEESRFFVVTVDESGTVQQTNIERISAVDSTDAAGYAEEALASGKEKGFVDNFRYDISESGSGKTITFLDCGRTLESFYSFLKASLLMSLLGLIAVFFVMLYFAGRIVRPVAESYEKQKRFITDAGHEIKTPLAIIKANIDLMDMEIDSGVEGTRKDFTVSDGAADSLKDSLGDINDQITRLTDMTNDLVYLSRMEEADNTLVMTEIPFSDIVSDTASSFEALAAEKGKMIEKDIAPMITVKGSSKELEKLVSILLENAVKYSYSPQAADCGEGEDGMPQPPVIEVALRKEGKNAVLEVRNKTENELTNDSLSHVFERFYRTDSSRNSATGGHGIGLSMANAIVSAHGGKITAHTKSGRDFIVTASIPLQ